MKLKKCEKNEEQNIPLTDKNLIKLPGYEKCLCQKTDGKNKSYFLKAGAVDSYCKHLIDIAPGTKPKCKSERNKGSSAQQNLKIYDKNFTSQPNEIPVSDAWLEKFRKIPNTHIIEIGQSRSGRPLTMFVFGKLEGSVLVIGGVHGDESSGSELAWLLLDHLINNPEMIPEGGLAILPIANPDGTLAGTRKNACKVDVNRNFPASNWKQIKGNGREPLSEPETAALMRVLKLTDPKLIVSIHRRYGGKSKPVNNYDGPAETIAKFMEKKNGYDAVATLGYPTPGSLGSLIGKDWKRPVITLELKYKEPIQETWKVNRDALLEVIHWPGDEVVTK